MIQYEQGKALKLYRLCEEFGVEFKVKRAEYIESKNRCTDPEYSFVNKSNGKSVTWFVGSPDIYGALIDLLIEEKCADESALF